jgi:NTP pyrophosphatase (non-canonical NTP hydrolase)
MDIELLDINKNGLSLVEAVRAYPDQIIAILQKTVDLGKFFELQAEVQKMHGHDFKNMSIEDRENYTKDTILYLLEETHELLREINFKTYKKVRKPVNSDNIREELADICAFFINLCLVWNVTPQQFAQSLEAKIAKNIERLQSKDY